MFNVENFHVKVPRPHFWVEATPSVHKTTHTPISEPWLCRPPPYKQKAGIINTIIILIKQSVNQPDSRLCCRELKRDEKQNKTKTKINKKSSAIHILQVNSRQSMQCYSTYILIYTSARDRYNDQHSNYCVTFNSDITAYSSDHRHTMKQY